MPLVWPTKIQPIAWPNLGMAESIGTDGKLNRDLWPIIIDIIETDATPENIINACLSNRQRQKFMNNDPLIVPADLSPSLLENLLSGIPGMSGISLQTISYRIMKLEHRHMEL